MNAHSLHIVPTDRVGAAHTFLRDGHGEFVMGFGAFNAYAKNEEEVITHVREFFKAIREGRLL